MRGHQELVNSHLPPHPHHLQGVAAANINNIRAQNFGPDPPAWNLPVHQKEQIDLHLRKSPKYSCTRRQYLSESELAVGIKSSFGCLFRVSRMISRSIPAVPLVRINP